MFVKSGKQIIKVEYSAILYFEALKEYVCIYTPAEKLLVYKRMKELEESLPKNFIRVHNSYIVSKSAISSVKENEVCLGETKIPIGETYFKSFMEFIDKFHIH